MSQEFSDLRKERRKMPAPDAINTDRLPPHSEDMERGVLGCALLSPGDVLNRLLEKRVTAEWFYDLRHQLIFNAMLHLHSRRDVPVDTLTLHQHLKDTGLLEQVGGIAYVNTLADAVPSALNVAYYLDLLREKFVRRRIIAVCTDVIGQAYAEDGAAVDNLLAGAEHDIESVSGLLMERRESHIKDVLTQKVIPQLEEHYSRGKQKLRGLSTNLEYLDKIVRGIRDNFYYVVAARPGDGKTSWAMNLVEYVAGLGLPVGVFTLEMTEDSLTMRLLFSVADVNSGSFEQGFATTQDFEKLMAGAVKLAAMNIYLDPDPDQTIEMIAAKARRMVADYGIKLFVLDYLQLLDDDSEKYRNDRVQALRRISKKIVSLKNKLNVPWLVLAQMNRNIETSDTKRPPVLSDLKECGAIEQDADVVMFLYKPLKAETEFTDKQVDELGERGWTRGPRSEPATTHDEAIELVMVKKKIADRMDWPKCVNASIAKNRYGPTGTAELLFQKNRCRFVDRRNWFTAEGVLNYGKGERANQNPMLASEPETDEIL
jgi:replicative DNA helicase